MDRDRFLSLAARLRRHPDLGPEGANVDFVTPRGREAIDIRFFERGIEGETLTSGTGCIASALALHRSGRTDATVVCRSRAGVTSSVVLSEDPDGGTVATLSGHARIIYTAVMNDEAVRGFTSSGPDA
jgi:diaminopimelate epimerase